MQEELLEKDRIGLQDTSIHLFTIVKSLVLSAGIFFLLSVFEGMCVENDCQVLGCCLEMFVSCFSQTKPFAAATRILG